MYHPSTVPLLPVSKPHQSTDVNNESVRDIFLGTFPRKNSVSFHPTDKTLLKPTLCHNTAKGSTQYSPYQGRHLVTNTVTSREP